MTKTITTETLQARVDSYGAILAHGDYTLATFATWTAEDGFGNSAHVYRLAEAPVTGFGPGSRSRNECALELVVEADRLFEDAGHAIAWTLENVAEADRFFQ